MVLNRRSFKVHLLLREQALRVADDLQYSAMRDHMALSVLLDERQKLNKSRDRVDFIKLIKIGILMSPILGQFRAQHAYNVKRHTESCLKSLNTVDLLEIGGLDATVHS